MRRAARVDQNHAEIVAALRAVGASVQSLAEVGRGVPDLIVGHHGEDFKLEIKNPDMSPSRRKLTAHQERWRKNWQGQPVYVIETAEQAVLLVASSNHYDRPQ